LTPSIPSTLFIHRRCRGCVAFALEKHFWDLENEIKCSYYNKLKNLREDVLRCLDAARMYLANPEVESVTKNVKNKPSGGAYDTVNLNSISDIFKELSLKISEKKHRAQKRTKSVNRATMIIRTAVKVLSIGIYVTACFPTVMCICAFAVQLGEVTLSVLEVFVRHQRG